MSKVAFTIQWNKTRLSKKSDSLCWVSLSVCMQCLICRIWFPNQKMSTKWNLEWTSVYLSKYLVSNVAFTNKWNKIWMFKETVCQFGCNDGCVGSGSQVRRCQKNETWSGQEFVCESVSHFLVKLENKTLLISFTKQHRRPDKTRL